MVSIPSLPVEYRGIRFRSTLEADWAEYFDTIGRQWFYEPEALQASYDVAWLPDFYLPQLRLFVECKGWHGDRLPKVGKFVRVARQNVLVCFPQGRFVLCSHYDWGPAEFGEYARGKIPDYLIAQDWDFIEEAMKTRTCLRTDEDGLEAEFLNFGEFCPDYCGYEPSYWNSMKDRNRPDGGDARSYYWGGYSTWHQRGFTPSKHRRA